MPNPDEKSVQDLANRVRGRLIRPEDAEYESARKLYTGMYDRRPALILQVAQVADVVEGVKFAETHDLMLAVRGGGHSVPGFGSVDDGLVLDLRQMRSIRVDPERRTALAQGGCTWADFNNATHTFGLATTGGVVSSTGVAGLTLGGGMGYLSRRCGFSCDNLISAEVVLYDGTVVTCSEDREKDLFWAIRGGGGNFGVVTSFEYRLHPIADIFGGPIFFPAEADVLRRYRDFITNAPEELGALFAYTLAPPLPFIPAEWHRKPVAAVITCWSGQLDQASTVVQPMRDWAPVVAMYQDRMPYPAINTLFDELVPAGLQQYWKGSFIRDLADDAADVFAEHGRKTPCIESGTFLFPIDGACHRPAADAMAFAWRDADFAAVISGAWPNPSDNRQNIAWVRDYYEAIRPYSEGGGYTNFISADDQDKARTNFGGNYRRLAELKARYDPRNVFRVNQNIEPAGHMHA